MKKKGLHTLSRPPFSTIFTALSIFIRIMTEYACNPYPPE